MIESAAIVLVLVVGFVAIARLVLLARRGRAAAADPPPHGEAGLANEAGASLANAAVADPASLEASDVFERAVDALCRTDVPAEVVMGVARSPHPQTAAIGLAALARRGDVTESFADRSIRRVRHAWSLEQVFLLRLLATRDDPTTLVRVLAHVDHDVPPYDLVAFVNARLAAGDELSVELLRAQVLEPTARTVVLGLRASEEADALDPRFVAVLDEWSPPPEADHLALLRMFARVWERPFDEPSALVAGVRAGIAERARAALTSSPRRSVVLVGPHGAGKTALARAVLGGLDDAFVVFEAAASQVNAGASFVGQLEGRVEELLAAVRGRPVVWVLPQLEQALHAGRYAQNPHGLLDAMLPHLLSGELTVVAETTPSAFERVLASRPEVASAFEVLRVASLDEDAAVDVARHVLRQAGTATTTDECLRQAHELAQHFVAGSAAPGALVDLVRAAAASAAAARRDEFDLRDVLTVLSTSSGVPLTMLDPTSQLDLAEVRTFFEQRVIGQADAIDAIVSRLALIKAGLTDPTRPLGVFLLVGPTGTGKTELAKALAEYLFGSAERMVRLDMSEFQTADAIERLLSDATMQGRGSSLIASVRSDPFSVVLLDEFEKAAPAIWDLFLQVFDDGRLSDQAGTTVDFRRCVLMLTSNVGSAIGRESGLGFAAPEGVFNPAGIERALARSFRPELLNRLDRVIVFRPFTREHMRALLDKELASALARRGIRNRPWAVIADETAYSFLIDQAFSPTHGARPLKRAVEKYLLEPVAAAIVEGRTPDGDRFMLVSSTSRDELSITFVDPDRDDAPADDPPAETSGDGDRDDVWLTQLALAPRADERAVSLLRSELDRLVHAVVDGPLSTLKQSALDTLSDDGFWERDDRFDVLHAAEYLDRLEVATSTAVRLAERLEGHGESPGATELARLLATRLYVIDRALAGVAVGEPADVFVSVAAPDGDEQGAEFAAALVAMYAGWAKRRGMRLQALQTDASPHVLAISGLGAGTILASESGLHVHDPADARPGGAARPHVTVRVAPWPPGPDRSKAALLALAEIALAAAAPTPTVVRRYRDGTDPLVRDAVRGYRTGRLGRVLAGDFDLFGAA